jgi:endonuclease YncB( thermonuclease family)
MAIGKKVRFRVEHKTANGREYGVVETEAGVSLAEAVAEAGWAEVRPAPDGKEPRT